MSAGPAAAGRNGTKGWSETGISCGSNALRLVLPPSRRAKAPLRRDGAAQPRSEESSRIGMISTDTDMKCAQTGLTNGMRKET